MASLAGGAILVQDFDAVKDELYKDIMEKKLRIAMAEEYQRLRKDSQIGTKCG